MWVMWAKLLGVVDGIAAAITALSGLYRDYTLRRAGRAESQNEERAHELDSIRRANAARGAVPDGVLGDPDDRDQRRVP